MAQSSSYKQYARATRVLTEESGFAGGMLWTGNNIDETHLKAIVNCDYDETTGYLKSRDQFCTVTDYTAPDAELYKAVGGTLSEHTLLGAYNICPLDDEENSGVAGWLYLFAKPNKLNEYEVDTRTLIGIFRDAADEYHVCINDFDGADTTLKNISAQSMLLRYENHLYGIGYDKNVEDAPWLKVFWVGYQTNAGGNVEYILFQEHPTDVQNKIGMVTLLEASVSGFNAARGKDTFTYASEDNDEARIGGVWLSDDGTPIASPRIGQEVTVNVPVWCPLDNCCVLTVFKLKENADTSTDDPGSVWEYVGAFGSDFAKDKDGKLESEPFFKHIFSKKETVLLIELRVYEESSLQWPAHLSNVSQKAYEADVVDRLVYTVTASKNSDNLKLKYYDLSEANGSCLWRNRLCVWGTKANNNCLFLSEVDNFYYFPIPNNVAVFDTNVVSCIPYKDTLLVFTADKIYRMSESNDGTFIQTVVQNDMPLSQDDSAHLTAIKNMVLFKSGNYFYMIVPKSQSLTDELTIAPIYKNIAGFLNNLDNSTKEVLQLLYPEYLLTSCSVGTTPTAVYSEQDTVHILYDVLCSSATKYTPEQTASLRFKMFLNYNTNLRAWTLYFVDTRTQSLEVAALAKERRMEFIRINAATAEEPALFDIVAQQPDVSKTDNFRILLDTGYRTLSASTQKRFREVQLKLYSASEDITAFGTAFLVDGVWRRNYTHLTEVSTAANTVSLLPELDLNTFVTELNMPVDETGEVIKVPGSDSIELSDWTLDFSHFKREAPVTVRVPVSGKGYNPRFIFMAPDAVGLTINEVNWVYRLMHGR